MLDSCSLRKDVRMQRIRRLTGAAKQEVETARGVQRSLGGGLVDRPTWADRPLTYYTPWEWSESAFRYRYRKGVKKDGKDMSWLFHKVPLSEQRIYQGRLKERRRVNATADK